ncbi:MAG: ShlB/FhaC/HecB family hemolysin secretion/activation protein [Pseudomonadota bacterium]
MPATPIPIPAPQRRCAHTFAALLLALAVSGAHSQAATESETPPVARFDVFEYRVEGNSVLPVERIERAVYPFLGEQRTVADVEAARVALEAAYRDAGFGTVLVDTPEQRVTEGIVTLQVMQAPVSRLRVVGSRYYSQGRIIEKVPALAEGQVPNFKAATEQLATVNRSADRRVTPLLRPGKTPGTTEVDLTVEDKAPLHASLELNDKYSANTTRTRLQASVRYDNLWQREHSVGVQVQVSPEDTSQVRVFSGSYTVPADDGLWVVSAVKSNSNTVAGVGGTTVFGRGSIFGLRRVVVLDGSDSLSHTLTWGADYKNFKESVSVGANEGFDTPIRYLPLSLGYSATVNDKQGFWQVGTGFTAALRGLTSRAQEFADKRYNAQSNFAIVKFDLARTQTLPRDFSLFAKLEGQITGQPLISNEQFVAGGADSVRGYLEAAAVGDNALRGSIELRSGALAPERWSWLGGLRAHVFLEGAALWLKSPLPAQQQRFGLLGTGVGLRVQAREHASLALDVGWPLRDVGQTHKGSVRLHASGLFEF